MNKLSSVYKLIVSYCSLQQLVLFTKYYQLLGSLRKSENENTGYRLQKFPLIGVELCVDGPGGGERRERELEHWVFFFRPVFCFNPLFPITGDEV